MEGPASGEEAAGDDGVGESGVERGAWSVKRGGVAGVFNSDEELASGRRGVGESEEGAFGEEVDGGGGDAGDGGKSLLDVLGASGAGHAGDGERDPFHGDKLHGAGEDVEWGHGMLDVWAA